MGKGKHTEFLFVLLAIGQAALVWTTAKRPEFFSSLGAPKAEVLTISN